MACSKRRHREITDRVESLSISRGRNATVRSSLVVRRREINFFDALSPNGDIARTQSVILRLSISTADIRDGVHSLLLSLSFCFSRAACRRSSCAPMRFHHPRRPRRETNNNGSRSLKADRDVGLSFLYHSPKHSARLEHSPFATYYSLAHLPMPHPARNGTRSVHSNFQILLYNFLERPAGFKCFFYHFFV